MAKPSSDVNAPPNERAHVLDTYRRFQNLPPERRLELRQRYRQLTPEQRSTLRERRLQQRPQSRPPQRP